MKNKLLVAILFCLMLVCIEGCTVLTSEQAALVGTGEAEETPFVLYAPGSTVTEKTETAVDTADNTVNTGNESVPEQLTDGGAAEPVEEEAAEERDLTPLPKEYFDDAIFFGDSVSGTLEYMDDNHGLLGKAITLVRNSYSVRAAIGRGNPGEGTLRYKNAQGGPGDILAALPDYNKAFIMLGQNDIKAVDSNEYIAIWTELVEGIRKVRPDIKIVFQSLTPITAASETTALNNSKIDEYNAMLREFTGATDCVFVEIGEHFKGEDGTLKTEYAKNDGINMNVDSGRMWVELLQDPSNYSVDPRS